MPEQLRLEDAPAGGGALPERRRRTPKRGEVWWVPGAAHYHADAIPQGIEYEHIVDRAVFGTEAEAHAAGIPRPCSKCAAILAKRH